MSLFQKYSGTGVAIVTPFKHDGSVDFGALSKITNHIIDGGCNYIVVLGTTGESVTLTSDEKHAVMDCILEANNKRVSLMLGMGGNNTKELISQLKSTDTSGFDAILSVSPYYNKPNQEGIFKHYYSIADASKLPVLLYNVPGRTGANVAAETTLRLSAHSNIFGIKEASGNMEQCMDILKNKPENFMVISGDDPLTLPFISLGMCGVISVVANAYPQIYSTMVNHCLSGEFEKARPLHYNLINTIKNMFSDGSPGGVKAYLNLLGFCEENVREPLEMVSKETRKKIENDFERLKNN